MCDNLWQGRNEATAGEERCNRGRQTTHQTGLQAGATRSLHSAQASTTHPAHSSSDDPVATPGDPVLEITVGHWPFSDQF